MSASESENGNGAALHTGGRKLRVCPTQANEARALITHLIDGGLCQKRQREFYHKCHRCIFRGQPSDLGAGRNGVARGSNGRD